MDDIYFLPNEKIKIYILNGWVFPFYQEKKGNKIIIFKNNVWKL